MNWKMNVSINESTNVIFTRMKELKNMRKSLVLSMKLYRHVLLCPSFLLEAFIQLAWIGFGLAGTGPLVMPLGSLTAHTCLKPN